MILILSNKWDLTVDFVVYELRQRGANFLRINTEDLVTSQATIYLPDLKIIVSRRGNDYDLTEDIHVIWNRRPGKPFSFVPTEEKPTTGIQSFINNQWFSWIEALQMIRGVTWVNHPQINDEMENKQRQLLLAAQLGFHIPDTVITNDPNEARSFAKKHRNKLAAKALYCPLIQEQDEEFFIFTNEIDIEELNNDEEIAICPTIYQQSLKPKVDYRVTVVGERVFPVEIHYSDQLSCIDWRTQKTGVTVSACNLPTEIENMCREYVMINGLLFGAIDLLFHREKYYFLEINPNGEWGWLQHPHGIPIAEALCDLLISSDVDGKT